MNTVCETTTEEIVGTLECLATTSKGIDCLFKADLFSDKVFYSVSKDSDGKRLSVFIPNKAHLTQPKDKMTDTVYADRLTDERSGLSEQNSYVAHAKKMESNVPSVHRQGWIECAETQDHLNLKYNRRPSSTQIVEELNHTLATWKNDDVEFAAMTDEQKQRLANA